MTATVTDLFCGAGGSSLGAEAAGMRLEMAANHWEVAIDVHQAHFPEARHDCADLGEADPRRYPRTDVLLASPECTNHSQARGLRRHSGQQGMPGLWEAPDPSAERSRATMWTVPHFAEQLQYDCVVVENVVEATRWVGWRGWHQVMEDLGYDHTVLSHNSMHHGVPQSRDRIYVVFYKRGLRPNLELELSAWCPRCDAVRTCRQAWKNGRRVGRHRQQYVWACTDCHAACEPGTRPAADIIDWSLPCPRIGDRKRPLAAATRARILAGLQRYGWVPIATAGAGNVYETTPGNRARPLTEPLPVQQATATTALATPPGMLVQPHHGGDDDLRVRGLEHPTWTVNASDDRPALVVPLRRHGQAQAVDGVLPAVTAAGNHHALVLANNHQNVPQPASAPLATVTTGNRHALIMRNNGGGAEMTTPASEPMRTVTTKGHQSLLVPYNGAGRAIAATEPLGTQPATDRWSLVDVEAAIDDCGFRMLEPHEVAAAMAFPDGYIPDRLSKKDRVRLAGNAVTPPVMHWIAGRLLQALEEAG